MLKSHSNKLDLIIKELGDGTFDVIEVKGRSNRNDAFYGNKTKDQTMDFILNSTIPYRVFTSYDKYLDTYEKEHTDKFLDFNNISNESGNVVIKSRLVSFIYVLLRDYITPGKIEDIISNNTSNKRVKYSNGWLAKYAENISNRLKS